MSKNHQSAWFYAHERNIIILILLWYCFYKYCITICL